MGTGFGPGGKGAAGDLDFLDQMKRATKRAANPAYTRALMMR